MDYDLYTNQSSVGSIGINRCHRCTVSDEVNMSVHCSDPDPTAFLPTVRMAKVLSRPSSLWCRNLTVRETCSIKCFGTSNKSVLLKTGLVSCLTTPVRSFLSTRPKCFNVTWTYG